jgi:hypothetical protein
MAEKLHSVIAAIGIDIGKNSLHVVDLGERGAVVLRQKWSRGQVETRFANLPVGATRSGELWDGMEHSRCGDDGRPLRLSSAGGPCSGSLMPDENSLFPRISSLFHRKFSLFGCVGNSVKEANDYARLGR